MSLESKLAEIKERLKNASKTPFDIHNHKGKYGFIVDAGGSVVAETFGGTEGTLGQAELNAELFVEAPTDLEFLLKVVEIQQRGIEKKDEVLKHGCAAMTYAYEDRVDQYYLNTLKEFQSVLAINAENAGEE